MSHEKKMASFRLTERTHQKLDELADLLTEAGPVKVNRTDALEMAVSDFHEKIRKKHRNCIDKVKT